MTFHGMNLSLRIRLKRFHESHSTVKGYSSEGLANAMFRCTLFLSVILFLLSLGACSTLSPGSGKTVIPRSDRAGLAVLNLKNATPRDRAGQFQPWEYGIATMLTTDLEAIGIFNVVERERLINITRELDLQKTDLVDKETAVPSAR